MTKNKTKREKLMKLERKKKEKKVMKLERKN